MLQSWTPMSHTPTPQHEHDAASWNEAFGHCLAGIEDRLHRGTPEAHAWSSGRIEGDVKRQAGLKLPRLVRD